MTFDIRYAYLSKLVYSVNRNLVSESTHFIDSTGGAWILKKVYDESTDGFQGAVFVNADTNEMVFAARGTEVSMMNPGQSLLDVTNDIMMGIGQLPDQYYSATSYFEQTQRLAVSLGIDPSSIVITGHSLGGALAQLLGAQYGNRTETFNAYGPGNLLATLGISSTAASNIINHISHFDPVSRLLGSMMIGQTYDYYRSGDVFFETTAGRALSLLAPRLFTNCILSSHGIGNFLEGGLNAQQGTAVTIDVPSPFTANWAALYRELDSAVARLITATFFSASASVAADPLTLDLDGDGIETVGINASSPVMFDITGSGIRQSVGWVGADDGFLVRDLNGNGLIDSGAELFGDATMLSSGQTAADGFAALADLDANQDGVVNAADAAFASLRVWRDLDQDGVTDAGELFTLSSLGIAGLNVSAVSHSQTLANGNQIADLGTYIRTDGQVGTLGQTADVNLSVDTFTSQFTDTLPVSEAVMPLPDMQGSGQVRSLHEAATLSPTLAGLLAQFQSASDRAAQRALLDQVVTAWADTSAMATTLTGAYAGHALTMDWRHVAAGAATAEWERKLTILERFNGRTFNQVPDGTDPVTVIIAPQAQSFLQQSYDALRESVYRSLAIQTRLQPCLDMIGLYVTDEGVSLDFTQLNAEFAARISADPLSGVADLADFLVATKEMLRDTGWDGMSMLTDHLGTVTLTQDILSVLANGGLLVAGHPGWIASGTGADDWMLGGDSGETISGGAGRDYIYAGAGNDAIGGGDGNDTLRGGNGNDTIYGNTGNDVIRGDAGNDTLYGGDQYSGAGNDTYVFGRGDGQDTLYDNDATAGNIDTVRLVGVSPSEVVLVRELDSYGTPKHLLVKLSDSSDYIRVYNHYAGSANSIEQIVFDDGTVWGAAELASVPIIATGTTAAGDAGNNTLIGNAMANSLYGGAGNDVIEGGEGNDTLYGGDQFNGAGNDTYVFRRGDGQDLVIDKDATPGNLDTIRLEGLAPSEVTLIREIDSYGAATNLVVQIVGTSDLIRVQNHFKYAENTIERIVFDDGTVWGPAEFANLPFVASGNAVGGNSADNTLIGNSGNNSLYGMAGNDTLDGKAGNDTLYGGDQFNGAGNDTYVFRRGDGQDTVIDMDSTPGNLDTIQLAGLSASEITLVREVGTSGSNNGYSTNLLVLINGSTDQVRVLNHFSNSAYQVERIVLDDGTTFTTADFNALPIVAGNGVAVGDALANTLIGGNGADRLYGNAGNDTLRGGLGNDTLYGGDQFNGYGNDTYVFGRSDGQDVITDYDNTAGNTDTLRLTGLSPAEVALYRETGSNGYANNLLVKVRDSADQIRVTNHFANVGNQIEQIVFDDGTVWAAAQLNAAVYLPSGSSAVGTSGADTFDLSGALATTAAGGAGNDTYLVGRNGGADIVADSAGADRIVFGANVGADQLWFRHVSNHLEIGIIGTSDKVTVQNWYSSSGNRIERIETAQGLVLLDAQVENLVAAMAAFAPPAAGQTTLPQTYQDALQPVIATNWQQGQ